MTISQLEKILIDNTKGLPKEALEEILDFIFFIRQKQLKNPVKDLTEKKYSLSASQAKHLEDEFIDYKKRYPSE
jgi:hypothetical protein